MSDANLNSPYNGQLEKEHFLALVHHYEQRFLKACRDGDVSPSVIGEDGSPSSESMRFKSANTLAFSLDDIKSLGSQSGYPEQQQYTVSFMGLLGASGILPQHYTKLSLERLRHGDFAISDFVGLFEHRLISLYYKSLVKYKLPLQYKEKNKIPEDNMSTVLKSLSGYFTHKNAALFYSGYFSKKNRSAKNLESMIADMTGKKTSVHSLVGRWLPILPRDQCRIGTGGANHHLPSGIMLGKRYWDIQSTIRIVIHDLDKKEYNALSINSSRYTILASTVSAYVPAHIGVIFEFRVKKKSDVDVGLGQGLQLSANAWLGGGDNDSLLIAKRTLKKTTY